MRDCPRASVGEFSELRGREARSPGAFRWARLELGERGGDLGRARGRARGWALSAERRRFRGWGIAGSSEMHREVPGVRPSRLFKGPVSSF